jgi:hypothetical protein
MKPVFNKGDTILYVGWGRNSKGNFGFGSVSHDHVITFTK